MKLFRHLFGLRRLAGSAAGFSLIEVMLALFLTAVLTAAMFKVYNNQHHAWMIEDSVIEMQQNARAAIDELTRQLRMVGNSLPNGMEPFAGHDTNPDTIVIYYKGVTCDAPLEHAMPQPSAELRCDGHDISCFYDGQRAYIYDPFAETGEFFTITQVQTGSSHIQHNLAQLSKAYPKGSIIMAIEEVKFYVDRADTLHPKLMVKILNNPPQIYAENITDLQFNYVLKNGMVLAEPTLVRDVRQINIELSARTANRDIDFQGMPYRHRNYESQVYLRNLGS